MTYLQINTISSRIGPLLPTNTNDLRRTIAALSLLTFSVLWDTFPSLINYNITIIGRLYITFLCTGMRPVEVS